MRCTKCGFENPDGMKLCGQCTNALALICPKCRFENPLTFKFCGQCTAPLVAPTREIKADAPIRVGEAAPDLAATEGERKTVTALFADIKGSTELMRDLGRTGRSSGFRLVCERVTNPEDCPAE
jgi:Double zinc ribbon